MPPIGRRLVALAALVALPVAALARPDQDPAKGGEKAIREILDRQVSRWNAGDLDGFAETYWRSPEVVFQSGGDRTRGWDAMLARYRKRYQGEGRAMGRLEFRDLEVRVLDAESGYAFGRWHLTMPDGSTPTGLFTLVLRKFPEGWRIVLDHTSVAAP